MTTLQRAGRVLLLMAALSASFVWSSSPAEAAGTPPVIRFFTAWAESRTTFSSPHLNLVAFMDDPDGRVPLTIASAVVTGPGGQTYNLLYNYPNLVDLRGQWFLDAGTTIPTGTYTLTVTDTQGNVVTATDTLGTVPPLSPATVTLPQSEQILTTTTPTFQWNAGSGAAAIDIRIVNLDIFSTFGDTLYSSTLRPGTTTQFTMPGGILAPGRRYLLRVLAYDSSGGLGPANIRAATQVPFSVAGPSVTMSLNKRAFVTGDPLLLSIFYRNDGASITVDAELFAGLPGGPAIRLVEVDLPLGTTPPDVSTTLVSNLLLYTFSGSEPAGNYVLRLLFWETDGPGLVGESSISFTFSP